MRVQGSYPAKGLESIPASAAVAKSGRAGTKAERPADATARAAAAVEAGYVARWIAQNLRTTQECIHVLDVVVCRRLGEIGALTRITA